MLWTYSMGISMTEDYKLADNAIAERRQQENRIKAVPLAVVRHVVLILLQQNLCLVFRSMSHFSTPFHLVALRILIICMLYGTD